VFFDTFEFTPFIMTTSLRVDMSSSSTLSSSLTSEVEKELQDRSSFQELCKKKESIDSLLDRIPDKKERERYMGILENKLFELLKEDECVDQKKEEKNQQPSTKLKNFLSPEPPMKKIRGKITGKIQGDNVYYILWQEPNVSLAYIEKNYPKFKQTLDSYYKQLKSHDRLKDCFPGYVNCLSNGDQKSYLCVNLNMRKPGEDFIWREQDDKEWKLEDVEEWEDDEGELPNWLNYMDGK
jgi:hypothetical protein